MKTVTKKSTYDKVMQMPRIKQRKPLRPLFLLQILIRILSFLRCCPLSLLLRNTVWRRSAKRNPA